MCSHCKHPGHLTNFYIQPGSKMAGHSMDNTHTTQHAASSHATCGTPNSSTHVATSQDPAPSEESVKSVVINGKTFYVGPSPTPPFGDFARTAICKDPPLILDSDMTFSHHTYEAYTTINGPAHVSLDWAEYSNPMDLSQTIAKPIVYSTSCIPASDLDASPFILDTRATIHISPIYGNFKCLHPIALHPITSVGGAHVYAMGMGSIELCIASGLKVLPPRRQPD